MIHNLSEAHSNFELDWLKRWNQFSPEAPALTEADSGMTLSYRMLSERAARVAAFLNEFHHIQPGDRIVHFSTNEVSSIVLFFALSKLGATLVPINYRLTGREISYVINNADPALIVFETQYLSLLEDIQSELKITKDKWIPIAGEKNATQSATSIEEISRKFPNQYTEFKSKPETTALIIYTSGTTGFPKGAMISHSTLFWNSINTSLRLNISQNDAAVIFLPLFHTGGWNVLTTPFFHRGAHIVLAKKFESGPVLSLSEKYQATLLFGVPTTMAMMSREPHFAKADLRSIRYAIVGGEPMPLEQIKVWHEKNIPIRQGYGLTEFGPNVFSLNEQDAIRKMGSIGFANFYVDAQVTDDEGKPLPANSVGELWLKGPMAMTGYWNNPEATAATFSNGWLKTGDLVHYDEEGYFYVVGRKKDMYKSGGENVYPVEIEQVLSSLPWVQEVAVVGVKDPQWGEVGTAFVVSKDGTFSEADLLACCQKNLAKFKIPKHFKQMKELPKGDSGKILKRKLTE